MKNRSGYLGMIVAATVVLTACSGEEKVAEVAPVQETPVAAPGSNAAPTISGTPGATATAGVAWQFQPSAMDRDGDALSFSATGLPAWATINKTTGLVSGTPASTSTGVTSNIVITVTDGKASASLPGFSIKVAAATKGTAVLRWSAPTQYTDGSSIANSELVAFHVYAGKSSTQLTRVAEVDAGSRTFTVKELDAGTYYFAVTAVSASGTESTYSAVGTKTIS